MMEVAKNTQVIVKHFIGDTAKALLTKLDNGKYQFKCDAYVVGEYHKKGFLNLRQARKVIPGKKLGNNIKFWPRLRKALHMAGIKPVSVPGVDYPIHYNDEVVVPDFSVSGTKYFIIKRSEIKKYLDKLPLDEAGKRRAEEYRQAHRHSS